MLNEKKESGVLNAILTVLCVLMILFFLFELWFERNFIVVIVDGSSMENTVFDGDYLYADIHAEAKRGDVVIIDVSDYRIEDRYTGDIIIKRLIGTEGDTVKCEHGVVYVKYSGEDAFTPVEGYHTEGKTEDFPEVNVGEGQIFFLGDHRSVSKDSRIVGCYRYSDIMGVVPQWAIDTRAAIKGWEQFRASFGNNRAHT